MHQLCWRIVWLASLPWLAGCATVSGLKVVESQGDVWAALEASQSAELVLEAQAAGPPADSENDHSAANHLMPTEALPAADNLADHYDRDAADAATAEIPLARAASHQVPEDIFGAEEIAVCDFEKTLAIDLSQALALAGGQNPQIAAAMARYRQAYAQYDAARTLWLPSIRAGVSFNHHDGRIQDVVGLPINTHRSALNAGLGTGAVGAGSPAVPGVMASFHAGDAIFQPKIAAQTASARDAAAAATTNDTLLEAALAHLELLRAMQQQRIVEQTRDNALQLADLTARFAETGVGPQADADRGRTELMRRRNEVSRAEEEVRVASARLAQVLSLDPALQLFPAEPSILPVDLVSPASDLRELIAAGLSSRPELAEAQHLVREAVFRYRREQVAPLVPSVLMGLSQTGFGAGLGGDIDDFGRRFDFDVWAFWELRNLGVGERARRHENRARYDESIAQQARVMDLVAREVVEAHAQVQLRRQQIDVAQEGVQAAGDSYRRNMQRIREGEGLPIELLQSMQALDESQREYLRTLADYNEAQFRLQRALGWSHF